MAEVCFALGIPRSTHYARLREKAKLNCARKPSRRALSAEERARVLMVLHEERFRDKAPAAVYAALLDNGIYLCSVRTMYRILESAQEVRERRSIAQHRKYTKPELLATAPNQVWSWDITKLKGPQKGELYYLYVMLDIYSRYAVGWMIGMRESAANGVKLITTSCKRQGIHANQLTIHSDRGAPMTAHSLTGLLEALNVSKSVSRPRVSNDNPFSEAQFKTLKYTPSFPARFGSLRDAEVHCREFFRWYNEEHFHSGIGMMTPATVHSGRAPEVRKLRQRVLKTAYAAHPERFVNGKPTPARLPEAAWINPPPKQVAIDTTCDTTATQVFV